MNKIKFNQKLLVKIFSTILIATAATLIIVGFFSFSFTGLVLQNPIMKNELAIAIHTMNEIDRMLYERHLDIQAIAGEESLGNYLLDYAKGAVDENQEKTDLKRIKDLAIVTGPWDILFVVDRNGDKALATEEKEIGESIHAEHYNSLAYKAAMEGKVYYSDLILSDDTGKPTIVFAAPIKDMGNPAKPVIGAVVGDFSWMAALQILDEVSTNAVLMSHDGNIIGSNKDDTKGQIAFNKSLAKVMTHKITRGVSQSAIITRAKGGLPVDTLVSLAGQKGYLSYKGNGWRLILSQPVHSVFAPANKSAGQMVLVLLPIIILMSGGISFMVHRLVVYPIEALTQTVHDISSGDLTKQTPVTSNDEIGQLAAAFNDMTGRLRESYEDLEEKIKQRTSELQASQEYSRSIIETANDAFISIDEQGLIREWNKKAQETFGWSKEEAVGQELANVIIPQSYREAHRKGMRHFLTTKEGPVLGKTLELTALRRGGHEFPVEITIWPLKTKEHYMFNAFVRDISERRRKEEELNGAYNQLEKREQEMRKALEDLEKAHDDLKQAQVQLLQSEKLASIGQLAAGIAHEINNPVGFINSNLQVMEGYWGDFIQILRSLEKLKETIEENNWDKTRQTIEEIKSFEKEVNIDFMIDDIDNLIRESLTGIERIRKIVFDLRTFARADTDKVDLVKIEAVIDSILSIVWNEIKYKVELKKTYGDVPYIKGNPQQLGQVFMNLLVNAAQAISDKGIIEIKTYVNKTHVCVDVSDTGCGIAKENMKKIFDPFFTTKPVGKGTGLGLSISYEIIKKHGGDIFVQSEAGKGSVFTVQLPVEFKKTQV